MADNPGVASGAHATFILGSWVEQVRSD
jgi:hypothetical protein